MSEDPKTDLNDFKTLSPSTLNPDNLAYLKSPEQVEEEKLLKDWKQDKHKVSHVKEFRIPHELINVLLTTNQYHGLVFHGEGGIGKTVLTLSSVKQSLEPEDWEYSNGYTTPLSLYELLYQNRKKKVIILDDVEGIFTNPLSLSILKGALWDTDGKRIVQYSSKSARLDIPQMFVIEANIIILCNNIPKEYDVSTRALLSRTISYEVVFSFKEKLRVCNLFVDKDDTLTEDQKIQIKHVLKTNVSEATQDFNFRTLRKLTAFVQYNTDKAEELFKATTITDELKEAYLKSCAFSIVVKVQASYFTEITGKSRRTFFNVKKQMRNSAKMK